MSSRGVFPGGGNTGWSKSLFTSWQYNKSELYGKASPSSGVSRFFSAARDLSTCDRLGALGSPSRLGQRLVLASARQTRVCLRVAVLSRWPQPRSVANLASPTRSRLSPWSSSSRPSKPRSRSRSPHGSLPAASSPYRGAGLCRGIPLRIRLALRGESAEPSPCVSLSSTLGFPACSSRSFFLLWPAVSRDCGAEGVFASG